jgi:polyphosphate kinase 2 (PPK2 family)
VGAVSSAEEDSTARDTEVRAMNKRMAEIASAADPSKLEAARFLVDQVWIQLPFTDAISAANRRIYKRRELPH